MEGPLFGLPPHDRTTYPALGYTVLGFHGGGTITYNHKTNNINYRSITGASFDLPYDPGGEWFDWMDRYKLWK